MRRCPACSTILFHQKVPGVRSPANAAQMLDVDGCPACAGIWLDGGELSSLGRDPAAMKKLAATIRATQPAMKPERTGKCPADGQPLAAVEYPAFPGLRFQGCGTCQGVWCEPGVLAALGERLAPSPAASVLEPAMPADGGVRTATERGRGVAGLGTIRGGAGADPTSTAGLPLVRAVAMPSIAPASGFFDRLSRGMAFIRAAYSLALEKTSLLVPTLLGGGAALAWSAVMVGMLFLVFASTRGFAAAGAPEGMDRWAHAHGVVLFAVVAAWAIGNYFIGFFAMGMTMSMIDAWLKGRDPELGVAFADSVKNILGIFQLAVVSFLVSLVIGMVRGDRRDRGIAGLLVSGIRSAIARAIEEAWTVLTFLLLPVIMIEDVDLKTALLRVRDIHRANLLQIAVGEVGILLVARGIGFLATMLAIGTGFAFFPLGTGGIVAWVIAVVAMVVALGVLQTFVRAAYYTSLYLWAVEVERAGSAAGALVPAPLAAALRPS